MPNPKTGRASGQPTAGGLSGAEAFSAPPSRDAVERALGWADPVHVEVVEQTGSTNDDLLDRARLAAPRNPTVRVAMHQLAGRGRHGRHWHDARGRALLFSVMRAWDGDPAAASAVTLACGIVVAETLRQRGIEAKLKWPNDLLLLGRKLGGILTELAFDAQGRASLVVGVGVNLCLDPETRVSIDQPAAALDERVPEQRLALEREEWIAHLARAVLEAIERFEREGFVPFRPRFEGLSATVGRQVVLMQAGLPAFSGVPLGVDEAGRLLLSTDSGVQAVASGELSLRSSQG